MNDERGLTIKALMAAPNHKGYEFSSDNILVINDSSCVHPVIVRI